MKQTYMNILKQFSPRAGAVSRSMTVPSRTRHLYQCSSLSRRPGPAQSLQQPFAKPMSHTGPRRHESSLAVSGQETTPPQDMQPAYQLTFTCKPCKYRSAHRVTKQGYHHGTTLITCPSCKARHLISDHLRIFSDSSITLEDIMKGKLEDGRPLSTLLKKGKLGIRQGSIVGVEGEEDLEFWEDGTETVHEKPAGEGDQP